MILIRKQSGVKVDTMTSVICQHDLSDPAFGDPDLEDCFRLIRPKDCEHRQHAYCFLRSVRKRVCVDTDNVCSCTVCRVPITEYYSWDPNMGQSRKTATMRTLRIRSKPRTDEEEFTPTTLEDIADDLEARITDLIEVTKILRRVSQVVAEEKESLREQCDSAFRKLYKIQTSNEAESRPLKKVKVV